MRLIIATPRLVEPAGSETYALTLGEHLARLGHDVMLYARAVGDPVSGWARARALAITAQPEELPETVDAVIIAADRALAFEFVDRYADAVRVYIPHSEEDRYLPPPVPGLVAATVALSDRQATRAAACVGAGEIVRLRQPVDLRAFAPRRRLAERPVRVLLLGNYHASAVGRAATIRAAWAHADLEWRELGRDRGPTLDVAEAMADVDIVIGYGRAAVEGLACGRAVYIHDHAGTDGWVTAASYPAIEAGGFAVSAQRTGHDAERIRADLDAYTPELGQLGHELARAHHDARAHAAEMIALIDRLRPATRPAPVDPSALRALILLSEAQLRAEGVADVSRQEVRRWSDEHARLFQTLSTERAAWQAERDAARQAVAVAEARLAEVTTTLRWRLVSALMRPFDHLRR